MSTPEEESEEAVPDNVDNLQALLDAADDASAATTGPEETTTLDIASLKQSLASLKAQPDDAADDVQQWKSVFGEDAAITDIADKAPDDEEDDGFELAGTF